MMKTNTVGADASRQTRTRVLEPHRQGCWMSNTPSEFQSMPRMSSGYRALLQSLDETEKDVTHGLGRQVRIKKRSSCCRCCCSRNACLWTCIATVVVSGLVLSIGIPILLTVPVESSWHWKHWLDFWKAEKTGISSSTAVLNNAVSLSKVRPSVSLLTKVENGILRRRKATKTEQTGLLDAPKEISDCRKLVVMRRRLSSGRPSLNSAR